MPLRHDEPADLRTFRRGPFGLDMLHDIDRMLAGLAEALDRIRAGSARPGAGSVASAEIAQSRSCEAGILEHRECRFEDRAAVPPVIRRAQRAAIPERDPQRARRAHFGDRRVQQLERHRRDTGTLQL